MKMKVSTITLEHLCGMAGVATEPAENPPTGKLFPWTVFIFIEKFKSSASGSGNTIQTGACSLNILVLSKQRESKKGSYRHMGKAQDVRPRPRGFQKLLSHQNNEVSKRSFVEVLQAKAATANGNKNKETLWWSIGVYTFRQVTTG